jgi:hypothetical protein
MEEWEEWDDSIPNWVVEDEEESSIAKAIREVSDLALALAGKKETSFIAKELRTVEEDRFRFEYLSVVGHPEVLLKMIYVKDQLDTISIVHETHSEVQVFLPAPDFLVCTD